MVGIRQQNPVSAKQTSSVSIESKTKSDGMLGVLIREWDPVSSS